MLLNDPVLLPLVGDHQSGNGDPRVAPSVLLRDVKGVSHLHVEDSQRRLYVTDGGLDLDNENDTCGWKEREEAPSLAVVVEAHLDGHQSSQRAKHRRDVVLQLGVTGVDQAIELPSLPGEVGIETRAERPGDSLQSTERHAFPATVLDPTDDAARHSGSGRQVRLGQPQAVSQDSEPIPDGPPHAPMMTRTAYPPITGRLPDPSVTSVLDVTLNVFEARVHP